MNQMSKEVPKAISKIAKSPTLEITLRIGKDGITEPVLSELVDQLKRRDIVKVKANKSISSDRKNRQQMFSEISERAGSTLVFQRGNVAVFWRTSL